MATYDGQDHLLDQLESIARQTRPPDELVVCDDGSRDETVATLESFAARAPFSVRVERNPRRLGSAQNFERAVGLCRGEIVFLADQDDIWLPEKIARHLEVFERRSEIGACFSNGKVVDGDAQPLGYRLWDSLWFSHREQERVRCGGAVEVFLRHVVAAGTTLSFRADYRELLLPFPELRSCHDAWIAFLIATVAEVEMLESDLILYRLHAGNQIGLAKPNLRTQLRKAREQLSQDPDSDAENAFAYADHFFSAALDRLIDPPATHFRASPPTLAAIEAKIAHSRRRARLPNGIWARMPKILGEAVNGNYWRYAYGVKSIAQDLWMR
jgi:glycosyltransferase involved in cell wall biosynthesis